MKHLILTLAVIGFSLSHVMAQNPVSKATKKDFGRNVFIFF
jgi:hypothetical protein